MHRDRTLLRVLPVCVLPAFALAVVLGGAARAQDASQVVGKWALQMDFQGQSVDVTLEIESGDQGLTGTWTSPRGSDPISDAKWDGKLLTFSRKVDRQGQQVTIACEATVDGEQMKGAMKTQRGDLPFQGKRQG